MARRATKIEEYGVITRKTNVLFIDNIDRYDVSDIGTELVQTNDKIVYKGETLRVRDFSSLASEEYIGRLRIIMIVEPWVD